MRVVFNKSEGSMMGTEKTLLRRDQFAVAALQGLLAASGQEWHETTDYSKARAEVLARLAYMFADAMMTESGKVPPLPNVNK